MQKVEDTDQYFALLRASGMTAQTVDGLLNPLNETQQSVKDSLLNEMRLMMAETLSYAWIIDKLRKIVEGDDKKAAVAALSLLAELSCRLLNIKPVFDELS